MRQQAASNLIVDMVGEQSAKPTEIYRILEKLVPAGRYLELFARLHSLRNNWVSVGNDLYTV